MQLNIRTMPFQAKGDEVTDDTAAFQQALDLLAHQSGIIEIPEGRYKITAPLNYTGTNSISLQLRGHSSKESRLIWLGPAGQTLFNAHGMNTSTFENVHFEGRNQPLYVLHLQSNQAAGGSGSSNLVFNRCTIEGWSGLGSAGVAVGNTSESFQVSELSFVNCEFGTSTAFINSGACFVFLGNPGNQKDASFWGGSMNGCDYGIDGLINSGRIRVDGVIFSNIKIACIRNGTGTLAITGCQAETNFDNARFVTGVGGSSNNPGCIYLAGNQFNGQSPTGAAVVVDHYGAINLTANQFFMGPTATPMIQTDPTFGSIASLGNVYDQTSPGAVFIDYSQNVITNTSIISSYHDMGRNAGTMSRFPIRGTSGGFVP